MRNLQMTSRLALAPQISAGALACDQNHEFLDRLFGEERRLTRILPHAFGELAILRMMYAALTRAADGWLRMTESDGEFAARTAPAATNSTIASRSRLSTNVRT